MSFSLAVYAERRTMPSGAVIDVLFDLERDINGHSPEDCRSTRRALSAPLVAELHQWLVEQRTRLSRGNDIARAIDYLLKRWVAFTRFLDDGLICINAAERALRGIALGRACRCRCSAMAARHTKKLRRW
jgi:transposase